MLFEGHTPPMATDSQYIKIDKEIVKEHMWLRFLNLSLENTEVKVYTSDIRREMGSKIHELKYQNQELMDELGNMDNIMF